VTDSGTSPRGRLLVVEDDDDTRKLVATFLAKSGFEVEGVDDGLAALQRLERDGIDLVLLDWMMPGLSGIEVLARIRERRSASELPVIMATARAGSADQVAALRAGANDYVSKPLDLKVLRARIELRLELDRAPTPPAPGDGFEPVREPPGPGRVLDSRWKLERQIGRGGGGLVFRGVHVALHKPVAVKVLGLGAQDAQALAAFRDEGVSACRVDHANAVQVIDFGVTHDDVAYLVMELLHGIDLAMELHLKKQVTAARCAEVLAPVCAALAEAHASGVIHRDIKPANIFLHRAKDDEVVKVLDFGVAKFTDPASGEARPSSGAVGTLSYAAPERLRGNPIDGRADVYSVATVAYEMLTGAPPFDTLQHPEDKVARMVVYTDPPPLRERRPDAPEALEDLLARALAKNVAHRPDARTFATALEKSIR
jgi:CheY-like chemotaxis protein